MLLVNSLQNKTNTFLIPLMFQKKRFHLNQDLNPRSLAFPASMMIYTPSTHTSTRTGYKLSFAVIPYDSGSAVFYVYL